MYRQDFLSRLSGTLTDRQETGGESAEKTFGEDMKEILSNKRRRNYTREESERLSLWYERSQCMKRAMWKGRGAGEKRRLREGGC